MNATTYKPRKKSAKAKSATVEFAELSESELDLLIGRIEQARDHQMALSREDYVLLLNALLTLASVQERLNHDDLTIRKLKKLLGIVKSSESLSSALAGGADESDEADGSSSASEPSSGKGSDSDKRKKDPKKKPPPGAKAKPSTHHHALEGMSKGDLCPACHKGKLYRYQPGVFIRIVGHAPLSSERHVCEKLRCNYCEEIFTAELPECVKADGGPGQKHGFSARSVMVIYRYFAGNPFYRQQSINSLLGEPISASTIFDQCEKVADALNPIFKAIKGIASDAPVFYLDDTSNRILGQKPVIKARNGKQRLRSGVYTSACLAITDEGRRLVLFQTNIGHAGEWIEEILRGRDLTRDPPIVMSDALSANQITTGIAYTKALCNAHGRRGFHELADQHRAEVIHALELYRYAWINEAHCTKELMEPEQRRDYHKEHSLPHMEALLAWCGEQLESMEVEPNSNLGRAMAYYIRHFEGLTAFCRIPGAPVDNNEIERLIKIIVRARKSSLFFKSTVGAEISDILTSVLATCHEEGVNAFEYLNAVQKNQLAVKASPEKWLPWNYPQDK